MTSQQPLHFRTLADTAAAIRTGEIGSEEVTCHILERIEVLEPRLHAFAELRGVVALNEARDADARRARGEELGTLHGVPVAVKDLCAMAGTQTRAGGFFSTGFRPTDTATVVARLQAAGAIIVGKTQLTEGAWGSHHPDIAVPVNPWSPDHWSGASSSGSGVSVAAGLAYGAIGTDTAGSIRFPSASNGLVGLKPTWGRVSRHGVFPLSDTFDHVGPMTRSVIDAAVMFDAIAGHDPLDPTSRREPLSDCASAARSGSLRGVRVGLDADYALLEMEEPKTQAFQRVLKVMEAEGAVIVPVRVPEVDSRLERAVVAAFVEAAISHARTYPSEKERYGEGYAAILEIGRATSALDYASIAIWRRELRGQLAGLFEIVDMIIAPVLPMEPPTTEMMNASLNVDPLAGAPLLGFTLPYNLAGVPSLTLPMGRTKDNAPRGFQLIGPHLSEARLLSAGAAYERASGSSLDHPAI